MIPLTNEQQKSHVKTKICYIQNRKCIEKYAKYKNYQKVLGPCYYKGK